MDGGAKGKRKSLINKNVSSLLTRREVKVNFVCTKTVLFGRRSFITGEGARSTIRREYSHLAHKGGDQGETKRREGGDSRVPVCPVGGWSPTDH